LSGFKDSIQDLLFLAREENFVLHKPVGPLTAGRYLRVTVIPAPGYRGLALIFVLILIFYAGFLALVAWRLRGQPLVHPLLPSLVLALNGTVRGCFKIREQRAALAEWNEPVGREVWTTRIVFTFVGLGMAGAAGWLFVRTLPGLGTAESKAIATGLLAVIEALRNATRIRGRYPDRDFRIEEHQVLARLGDAATPS